ncbi:MAG: glycosyltransferase [Abditibacteriota bacterium]|nr:glycosyltransferase [Abditibacteriota bacterium]
MDKIAVLIPCYNEELTIKKVVEDFKRELPEATIYVYDNNSKDNTAQIAKDAGAVVIPEYKQGKGNVLRSMFRDIDAECYLMVDGDDTYPANEAKKLVDPILTGRVHMTLGDRLSSTYFTENKRPFHNSGNKLLTYLINLIFHAKIHDLTSGYRGFSYLFAKSYPILSQGFEIETEMTVFALDKKMDIVEEVIQYRDRPEGSYSKLNTFKDGFKVITEIFSLFKDIKPLTFFGIIAIVLFLIGLGGFISVYVEFLNTGLVPRIPTLIMSVFMGFLSVLSFSSGLILHSIKKYLNQLFELRMSEILTQQRKLFSTKQ